MTKTKKIKIKVNGKKHTINHHCSINDLLNKLKIPKKMVAIELNKKIVDKKRVNKMILKQNDIIEIVHFIGGG